MEPKLSITNKPIIRPMNYEDCQSNKECELFESYHLLCYFLASALYTIVPLL